MVMGSLKAHYVEIEPVKNAFKLTCSCGWNNKSLTRTIAKSNGHLHLAGYAVAP